MALLQTCGYLLLTRFDGSHSTFICLTHSIVKDLECGRTTSKQYWHRSPKTAKADCLTQSSLSSMQPITTLTRLLSSTSFTALSRSEPTTLLITSSAEETNILSGNDSVCP